MPDASIPVWMTMDSSTVQLGPAIASVSSPLQSGKHSLGMEDFESLLGSVRSEAVARLRSGIGVCAGDTGGNSQGFHLSL